MANMEGGKDFKELLPFPFQINPRVLVENVAI
jgi:hypothetical protein